MSEFAFLCKTLHWLLWNVFKVIIPVMMVACVFAAFLVLIDKISEVGDHDSNDEEMAQQLPIVHGTLVEENEEKTLLMGTPVVFVKAENIEASARPL